MAQRGRPSITKRQKELSRLQRQQDKAARRSQRRQDRLEHPDGMPEEGVREHPADGVGEQPPDGVGERPADGVGEQPPEAAEVPKPGDPR